MKLVSIIGARPQFIKAAAIARAANADLRLTHLLVHTGQHYDDNMSRVFFEELEIPAPDHNLGIGSGSHGAQTGRMLEAVEQILAGMAPDWVLVYGDTNSTLAGALAAAKLHLAVAHVEAGLRSHNRRMAEEINRILTDHASDVLFAPTQAAAENLRSEGIPDERVGVVGDVMYDAALYYGARAERRSGILRELGLCPGSYLLATIHRAENTDDPRRLRAVFTGLDLAAQTLPVILPLHPRTREALKKENALTGWSEGLRLIEPVGYLDMIMLEKNAREIVTDSGGVQKEAYFYRVPCVTLREETEWVELVDSGWNRLAPPHSGREICDAVLAAAGTRGTPASLYGDGTAAEQILDCLAARPGCQG